MSSSSTKAVCVRFYDRALWKRTKRLLVEEEVTFQDWIISLIQERVAKCEVGGERIHSSQGATKTPQR